MYFSPGDGYDASKKTAVAAALFVLALLNVACATQLPPAATGVEVEAPTAATGEVVQETPPAAEAPAQNDKGEIPGEQLPQDRRGSLNLVVFELVPGLEPHQGEALEALIEGHQKTMAELHERGLRAASMRTEDGSFVDILDAPTLASLENRFRDDPVFFNDDFRISAAEFGFTVGSLCENAGGGEAKKLQMLWFARDTVVLERGGALAPTPFGAELGQLDEVVAAGNWGYGHLGFVFLDLPSPEAAEKLLASFPVPVDPQWSYTVHSLAAADDTFCK